MINSFHFLVNNNALLSNTNVNNNALLSSINVDNNKLDQTISLYILYFCYIIGYIVLVYFI